MQMNNKKSCEDIQQLFVTNEVEKLSEAEKAYILDHLEDCEKCRNMEKLISNFEKTGSIQPNPDPASLHELRATLIQRFRLLNQQTTFNSFKFLGSLKNVMNYRIPVYQVIGILFIVVLGYVFMIQKPLLKNNSQKPPIASIQQDSLQYKALDIFINMNYLPQMKNGRNSEEDSLLTRYIYRSL